jgi:hypothetical protein
MNALRLKKLFLFVAIVMGALMLQSLADAEDGPKLSLSFKKTPLRKVLAEIYRGREEEYSVNPAVADVKLTFTLKNETFQGAIRRLVRIVRGRLPGFYVDTDTEHWVYDVRKVDEGSKPLN